VTLVELALWHTAGLLLVVTVVILFRTTYRTIVFSLERHGVLLRKNLCWMLWICTVLETGIFVLQKLLDFLLLCC